MQQVEVIDSFKNYKNTYADENRVSFEESFNINPSAVKKQAKNFKRIIKLDKNFHIYIHGKREFVEKGFDGDRGLHYYKLFYEEEN